MANQKPLDPMATPYNKIQPKTATSCFIYVCPQTPTYYTIYRPVVTLGLPPYQSYNVRFQPSPFKTISPPLSPSPVPEKKTKLNPVPTDPRTPRSSLPGHSRRMVVRFRKNQVKVVEQKKVSASVEGKQRWKNKSGGYQDVLPFEKHTTSVMIKNIPNKYTRSLLIQTLDNHCKSENEKMKEVGDKSCVSAYDFVYLPIDFFRRVNAGFAFVNFTTPEGALKFRDAFDGKNWKWFESCKIAEISRARIQGKLAMLNNYKVMDFTYGSEEDMPMWFEPARDGSGQVGSKMFVVGKFLH